MKFRFLFLALLAACQPPSQPTQPPKQPTEKKPTAADATAFTKQVNGDLKRLWVEWGRAEWVKSTYITDDTEQLAADAHEEVMEYTANAIKDATKYQGLSLDPKTDRMLLLLRLSQSLPSPSDEAKRKKLAEIASKMEGLYGKGKFCKSEKDCRDLGQLSDVLAKSRDYEEQLEAWAGWHSIGKPIRPLFAEYVALANEGAKETGFEDVGELWKSGYDMTPAEFEQETERLWQQVKPLYDSLHCYVRAKLHEKYKDKVPADGKIPAHILGNMWAQEWTNIYPLVEPYAGVGDIDVTKALQKKKYEAKDLVKLGESFFTSVGLDPLPQTFWDRSQFTQPKDRDVVCHASAWDVTYDNDLRIKMCIKINEEDLITIHHELGHNYYYMYYHTLPVLFQNGAHDGFHEAIGDALALSVTPGYLKNLGILDNVVKNDKALINLQMKDALEKIAFLPFGKLIDQWRWDVFSGKTSPENYNAAWWTLRERYQGIQSPLARSEEDFDPGAKYHIPANVSYVRYFLARILQFQFHQALCQAAGHEGPLNECSIYGSKPAGAKLKAMLELGASKPWPDALEALTGTRQMDAGPILAYFKPLSDWLATQNQGKQCGW
jgi:peptidyl-dipeptidase A